MNVGIFFAVATLLASCLALSPTDTLSLDDQARLKQLFEQAIPFQSVGHAHYAILGLSTLGATIPKAQDACSYLKSNIDTSDIQSIYHATSAAKALGNCKIALGAGQETLTASLSESAEVADLFFAVSTQSALGLPIKSADIVKALDTGLKRDDSILGTSYALHIASQLSKETNVDKYFELIEDIVAQADTIDDKYLQFDNLQQASVFVTGAYTLATKVNKKPLITDEQAVQLANYILTRKATQTIRNAYLVVAALKSFSGNTFQVPVAFSLSGSMAISKEDPFVKVGVSDVMSKSLGKLTVKASSVVGREDDETLASNQAFAATKDETIYQLDLMKSKPSPGFYIIQLAAAAAGGKPAPHLIGLTDGEVTVKVTTQVSISNVEISVVDREQSITAKTVKATFPTKSKSTLDADVHQNVVIKFTLADKSGAVLQAHQTFIRVFNVKSNQEVTFTADSDSADVYKFTLDIAESGKDFFNQQSGKYTVDLIVGDAIIQNPFIWNVIDINLKFPDVGQTDEDDKPSQYSKKPNLEHMFRVPEKRPPVAVSTAFTGLVLLPLAILVILWIKLGANIKNFSFSLSALGFHGGLGAIFGLLYCYWAYLTMFATLRYLAAIGIFTFLCGNRLLRSIAETKN
ncbi:dolichyl-diphosphooligosaccharide--protein glycosyltransferase subunit 2-like isoform X2 [Apostichopus japonicus]|uniref:dolichyl-diphosphooligosaccharide--protein glycosyltransferase subunit 2-like isoform X2 n=1 Tax=Stichopus japonicus TaxID=307972 RepID=UPI003AB25FE4